MNFELEEHHKMFRDTFRKFAETEILPLIAEAEEHEKFPRHLFPRMGELGFLGIRYPNQYGGAGADKITDVIQREELSRICQGIASSISAHTHLGIFPIHHLGTEEQKQKYLVPAIKGQKVAAFALTEPNAGSDVKSIETVAVKKGEDYILNGRKVFTTNGNFADFITTAAYTEKKKGYHGISLFIVEKGTPGLEVIRTIPKECARSSETAEIAFSDCKVPAKNLIGLKEGAWPMVMETLSEGRIGVAGNMVGVAQCAFEFALNYAKQRVQFGQPIGKFQAIAFKLADMATEIKAARLMVYEAAWLCDRVGNPVQEASMCKLYASEAAVRVSREAIQICGGYGLTREFPVCRCLRDALMYCIGEGTSEMQRIIISKQLGL